jgi:hypothetical protein
VVYADQMLDEDYYGRGVCRWQLIQAQVQLKATGAEEEARFVPKIPFKDVLFEGAVTTYLVKKDYPRVPDISNYPAFGHTNRSRYGANIRDEDLFTITLSARKEAL